MVVSWHLKGGIVTRPTRRFDHDQNAHRVGIHLLANASGLIVAAVLLAGMSITGAAFVIAVLIFTIVEVVADPP